MGLKSIHLIFLSVALLSIDRLSFAEGLEKPSPKAPQGQELMKLPNDSTRIVVVPNQLPPNADLSSKEYLRFKIFETTRAKKPAKAYMVVRFSCDPLRYSAWIVNEKQGVSGAVTQIQFDDQAVLNIAAFKQTPKTLVLEDAWDESEKSFIDRIRSTKDINVTYLDGQKKIQHSIFMVSNISKELASAEKACFDQ